MTEAYVFDTEAILAFLYEEPGHDTVATRLDEVFSDTVNGFLSATNASEVFYLVARFEGSDDERPTADSLRVADRDVRALERNGVSITTPDWRLVGEIKAHGRISLADATAVALAADRNATLVVGADDDFDELPVQVEIERFRDHAV